MQNNFDYYLMRRKGDQAYPLLKIVDEESEIMELVFNSPVPANPVLADYLSGPEDFVTKKISEAMQKLGMDGVEFIPTRLTGKDGAVIEEYVCISVDCNTYEAMDKEKSEFEYEYGSYWIEKIVLDIDILKNIPFNKRLGFRLREAPGYSLYHKSVVDAIISLNPTGVYFQNIEEYTF